MTNLKRRSIGAKELQDLDTDRRTTIKLQVDSTKNLITLAGVQKDIAPREAIGVMEDG